MDVSVRSLSFRSFLQSKGMQAFHVPRSADKKRTHWNAFVPRNAFQGLRSSFRVRAQHCSHYNTTIFLSTDLSQEMMRHISANQQELQ